MKLIVKGFVISVIIFTLFLIIISIISNNIDMTDKIYVFLKELLSIIPIVISVIVVSKVKKTQGLLNGVSLGILYCIFLLIINSIFNGGFSICGGDAIKYVFYIVLCAISGILSVNY